MINNSKILIVRLPKGVFGEEPTNYFSSFTLAGLQVASMARASIAESVRSPFYLYVDEFQNFGTDATEQIFSEARKFKLYLTVAHQYLDQLDEKVRNAIFGNVGSYVSFRVRERDAAMLADGIDGFNASIISGLAKGQVVAQLLNDGEPRLPIQGVTYPPSAVSHRHAGNIKRQCRKRYCRRTDLVERQILSWIRGLGAV